MTTAHFDDADFGVLPAAGFYKSTIVTARFRTSEQGNGTLQVVHELAGLAPGRDRVAEYFVLEGGSPRGLALSRRRLVELYRSCGLSPKSGDEIDPSDLLDRKLEVRVEHDEWQGRPRLRVASHRAPDAGGYCQLLVTKTRQAATSMPSTNFVPLKTSSMS